MTKTSGDKMSLKQHAYNYIKEGILECRFPPNMFFSEQMLCESIGEVSRTPVRDALGRLEQERLITIIPKKGVLIAPVRFSDINKIYEVRTLIETYAIKNFGSSLSEQTLNQFLDFYLHACDATKNEKYPFYEKDDSFHEMLVSCLENQYLLDTYHNIKDLNRRSLTLARKRTNTTEMDHSFHDHIAIIQTCLDEKWERAAELLQQHLVKSRLLTIELIIANDENVSFSGSL